MDISSKGKGGGPYASTNRIINSNLSYDYDFRILHYKNELGKGISFRRINDLVCQIKKINPDIVHFSGLQLSGFHIAVACKIAKIKNTVVTIRGFSGDALNLSLIKKILISYFIEPLTLLLTKKICGNSNYTTNRGLVRIFNHKVVGTIYNFPPLPINLKEIIRKKLGISKTDLLVVTVGRITKDKGYNILDEAIMQLAKYDNIKFVIIGNGSYLPEMKMKLKKQIESNKVFFLGYRSNVQELIKGCDIFVLPTLHETLSGALLEASVIGMALVASNTGGVPEIVENGFNGLLIEPGSTDQLTFAIEKLYKNPQTLNRFSNNAKIRVAQKFSIQSIESELDSLYKNLLH